MIQDWQDLGWWPADPPPGPRPADQRGDFVETASGRRLGMVEAGAGRDVLLIHGTLTAADDMRIALFDRLRTAYRVVAIDRPSHGRSDRIPLADASLWSQAETLREAALALGLRRPILVGHSYGGAVALAMAMAFPDLVSGVVALAPVCFPEPRLEHLIFGPRVTWGGQLAAALDPVLLPVLWRAMFLPEGMPDRFAAEFPFDLAGRLDRTTAEGESATMLPVDLLWSAARYATCRVPVHFIAGTLDIVVNPLHSIMASSAMPDAHLHLLHGAGHMLHHTHGDAVVECVDRLSRSLGAPLSARGPGHMLPETAKAA